MGRSQDSSGASSWRRSRMVTRVADPGQKAPWMFFAIVRYVAVGMIAYGLWGAAQIHRTPRRVAPDRFAPEPKDKRLSLESDTETGV